VKRLRAVLCLWLLAPAAAASAQALTPIPPLSGPVVDRAGLLSPSQRAELDTLARELQAKTGAQMAVLTVESTAPEEIFGYGLRVAEAWQLGSREKDDGLLLVLASRDRKLRFFTGYGLEGVLPDGKLGRILDRDAIPRLQRGEPGEAIVAAMQAAAGEIAADAGVELTGVAPRAPPAIDPLGPQFLLIGLLILCMFLAIRASGSRRRRRYRPVLWGGGLGGLGSGGFGGGYGGGGGFGGTGGFGGGGGGFGGGGAGRGW
jgi:uncharacterized protein